MNDEDFEEEILEIRSSEKMKKINLSIEERFKAFKSWIAGIAEAGKDAIKLQYQIDKVANLQYPISLLLLKSLCYFDLEFFYNFIEYIRRNCIKEGIMHKACITANARLLLGSLISSQFYSYDYFSGWLKLNNNHEMLLGVIKLNLYIEVFKETDEWIYVLSIEEVADLKNFRNLFYDENMYIRRAVAQNPNAPNFEEYRILFSDANMYVRAAAAQNPNAPNFEEYKMLFKDKEFDVKKAAALNPNAPKFEEYKILFKDIDWYIRKAVANNLNAPKFEEFKLLLKDITWEVRRVAASNPNATKLMKENKI
ncbi:MAG: hypothetical protein ACTSRZ_07835 [Promethearchaeota archaeon]